VAAIADEAEAGVDRRRHVAVVDAGLVAVKVGRRGKA
jgi:hypothetical protein